MGSLTDDMTRLCTEIVALRGLRQTFVQDLVRTVAQLKAGFRQAHAQMSRETREGRARAVFDLKMAVAGLRQDNLLDLQGAHLAWFGVSPGEGRTRTKAAPQAKAQPGGPPQPAKAAGRQAAPKTGGTARRAPAKGGKAGSASAARKRSPSRDRKKRPG